MDNYLQVNQQNQGSSGLSHLTAPTGGSQLPIRQQYAYNLASSPPQIVPQTRFVDSNPRPTKSPRHVAPAELPANTSYPEYGARFPPQYGGSNDQLEQRGAGNFPSAMSMQTWTGAPDTSGIYGTSMPALASNVQGQYQFPNEPYPKADGSNPPSNYPWSSS